LDICNKAAKSYFTLACKLYKIGEQEKACEMPRTLYGLKQAAIQWLSSLSLAIVDFSFTQSKVDYTFFIVLS